MAQKVKYDKNLDTFAYHFTKHFNTASSHRLIQVNLIIVLGQFKNFVRQKVFWVKNINVDMEDSFYEEEGGSFY